MNCLADCIGKKKCKSIRQLVEGETQSPFVVVTFGVGESQQITVGNESAPGYRHHAVIKNFEWGQSDGTKGEFEVLDEEGGMFESFIQKMIRRLDKNYSLNEKESLIMVQFGWVISKCDGTTTKATSPPLYGHPIDMQVTFADGKVKYKITFSDLIQVVFASREDMTLGTDTRKLELQRAIEQLMGENDPKMDVLFVRREQGGNLTKWDYRTKTESTWSTDQQNKLAGVMKWNQPFRTDHDKGVMPMYDPTREKDTLLMLEDVKPGCDENIDCDRSIGTFLVNGGNCSNVISFSPSINWAGAFMQMMSVGGNVGGPLTGKTNKIKKPCGLDDKRWAKAGAMEALLPSKPAVDVYGTEEWSEQLEISTQANAKATEIGAVIDAELKIQGDPTLTELVFLKGRTASLVVINPFHLKGGGSKDCGDWLAVPMCNAVLSNKNWEIMRVAHSIREGSYVTTLKLRLPAPNSTLSEDANLGGDPDGFNLGD